MARDPLLEPPLLLRLLADGRLQSGEALARQLGVSRAAVWKGILRLRQRGIAVDAVARRGYALPAPVELLEEGRIRAGVAPAQDARLRRLELAFELDSTNSRLLAAAPPPAGRADVLLAELQTAGRGRRGRAWAAPFGASLAVSLAWTFAEAAQASPTLSLCVGVAVARALCRLGARGVGLKWPNDLWLDDRKMGGVLIELRAEAGGPAHVVMGVGLNVDLAPPLRSRIEASGVRIASVAETCPTAPSRNAIAGAIIDELLRMLGDFEHTGFPALRDEWSALDALRDRPAAVVLGGTVIRGTARGVSAEGALRLESGGGVHEYVSGEVSLRLAGDES